VAELSFIEMLTPPPREAEERPRPKRGQLHEEAAAEMNGGSTLSKWCGAAAANAAKRLLNVSKDPSILVAITYVFRARTSPPRTQRPKPER